MTATVYRRTLWGFGGREIGLSNLLLEHTHTSLFFYITRYLPRFLSNYFPFFNWINEMFGSNNTPLGSSTFDTFQYKKERNEKRVWLQTNSNILSQKGKCILTGWWWWYKSIETADKEGDHAICSFSLLKKKTRNNKKREEEISCWWRVFRLLLLLRRWL